MKQGTTKLAHARDTWRLVRRFAPYTLPYWDKMLLRVVYRMAYAVIGILGAMATVRLVDDGLTARDPGSFLVWSAIKVLLSAHVLVFVAIYANVCYYVYLRLNLRFKRGMFQHVQRMALAFHQGRPLGENMYRINNDTEAATDFAANIVPEPVERITELVMSLSLLLVLSPLISALLAVYIAVYCAYSHFVVGRMSAQQHRVRSSEQGVATFLQEAYTAYGVSKAFTRERYERLRYFHRLKEVLRARLSYFSWLSTWMEGQDLIREVLVVQVSHAIVCGFLVISGRMTIGEFVAVAEIINLVAGPLLALVATLQRLRVAAVPVRRMLETLDVVPEIQDRPNAISLGRPRGEIQFENVSFRYTPEGRSVLRNVSFRVRPGSKVAIVGVSGAGKTSIFNLLMRFADPTEGRVLIDGHDLRDLCLRSYREQVSVVLQESFLFSSSIRDNILVGNPDADDAALEEAIQRAGLGPTLGAAPHGLDTILQEGGNLSMGQKQRIGIARAVIRNPRFLYLDEATSSLDPVTEEQILGQLEDVERDYTCLVIAHSLAAVRRADEILVMEGGKLVQQGGHEELVADTEGAYARLWAAERIKRAANA